MMMFRIPFPRRSRRKDTTANGSSKPRARTRLLRRLALEPLEDRTLLDGNYMIVGRGLANIATALQQGLNDHLWNPSAGFSLPIVGRDLSAGAGQFLGNLANQLQSVTATDWMSLNTNVHAVDSHASIMPDAAAGGVQQNQAALELAIQDQPVTLGNLNFQLGLPGLDQASNPLGKLIRGLENSPNSLQINGPNVSLSFSAAIFFDVDSQGTITLDTTQNNASAPLVQVDFSVSVPSKSPLTTQLTLIPNFINVNVTGAVSLTFGATLSDAAGGGGKYNASTAAPSPTSTPPFTTTVTLGNLTSNQPAQGTIDLTFTVAAVNNNFPSLYADLNITSPLAGTNPLDQSALSTAGLKPTITIGVGIADLSSLDGWLNPVLKDIKDKLQPIKPFVDTLNSVLTTPIPILSDLLPQYGDLEDILSQLDPNANIQQIGTFISAIDGILNWSGTFASNLSSSLPLATYTLPDDDPRTTTFDLGKLLDEATSSTANNGQSQLTQIENAIQQIIPGGTLSLPALTDPLDDLKAFLLGDNVVLVQYEFPKIDFPAYNNPDIITLPIVPPLALTLGLVNVGVSGDMTVGYDTYGFSPDWIPAQDNTAGYASPAAEGFFITDPSYFQLMGGVSLSLSADLGLVSVGGGGTLNLQFGIQGLHEGTAFPIDPTTQTLPADNGMVEPYHTALLSGKSEKVLQLGDLQYDLVQGGPLCPFNIGGSISIGLEAYITVGVGPFSVTVDVDFGNITIASFTIDTCGGNQKTPQLAELFNASNLSALNSDLSTTLSPAEPQSAADIDKDLRLADKDYSGTQQFILLDLGQFDKDLQAENYNSGQSSESFEVSPVPKSNDLLVSAYGLSQRIPNANSPGTTILAFGGTGSGGLPEDITVDEGIDANVALFGGSNVSDFEYDGDGDCYMEGGTWDGMAKLPKATQTLNTLVGGGLRSHNYLLGGGVTYGAPEEYAPSWNVLVGGQDGSNTLLAGAAGATLRAGDQNGDMLYGYGAMPISQPNSNASKSTCVMVAGGGNDTMLGSPYTSNVYQWIEMTKSDKPLVHDLTIFGTFQGGTSPQGPANEVEVAGTQGFETWWVNGIAPSEPGMLQSGGGHGPGVSIAGSDNNNQDPQNQDPLGQITAYDVQKVDVDADDSSFQGGEDYIVNRPPNANPNENESFYELSQTGITHLNLNVHQWNLQSNQAVNDQNPDNVTIYNTNAADQLTVFPTVTFKKDPNGNPSPDPKTGQPIYENSYTNVEFLKSYSPDFTVSTALTKSADTLRLYGTETGDFYTVAGTQPNQTYIQGAGDDTIYVGGAIPNGGGDLYGSLGLDAIEGPLVVDAGSGHNRITFDEQGATVDSTTGGEAVTLTSNLAAATDPGLQDALLGSISEGLSGELGYLLRYHGTFVPATSGSPPPGRVPEGTSAHYRYPVGITFLATGGDYALTTNLQQGVTYKAPYSTTVGSYIYVASVQPNFLTEVETDSPLSGVFVGFDGGRNNAVSDPKSTLQDIEATLTIVGAPPSNNALGSGALLDDVGTNGAQSYVVSQTSSGDEEVSELKGQFVDIILANVPIATLMAPDQDNDFSVHGTAMGTYTTIDTGNGNNMIGVGQLNFAPNPPVSKIDDVSGPVLIKGGKGTNDLSIEDDGGPTGQTYTLGPASLKRSGGIGIGFENMSRVTLNVASYNSANNTIQVTGTHVNTSVVVNTGSGTNTITLGTPQLGLDPFLGRLLLTEETGADDSLTADDTNSTLLASTEKYDLTLGPTGNLTLPTATLQRSGLAAISYELPMSLLLEVRSTAQNTVDVEGTQFASPVTIHGGSKSDDIEVGDPQQRSLSSIAGQLTINGGVDTSVTLEDQGAGKTRTYAFYTGGQNGYSYFQLDNQNDLIQWKKLTALVLDASQFNTNPNTAGNTIYVDGTAAGTNLTINASTDDSIQVGTGGPFDSLHDIQGRLDVVGKGPNVYLELDDANGPPKTKYTLTATELDFPFAAPIGYKNIATLLLSGCTNYAVYEVQGTPAGTKVAIDGSGVNNELIGPSGTNTWQFETAGQFVQYKLNANVTFVGIQKLQGGSGTNTFKFIGTGFSGSIAGGSGTNTLDYSAHGSSSVVVDLQTGFATGVANGVSGIEDVIGANGGGSAGAYNLLIGSGGNILTGGTGRRNILVAGKSASTLNGGDQEDLLIAGYTSYDTQAGLTSWQQIAAYWAGTDSFTTRVTRLEAGTGVPTLDAATVTGNGGNNTLVGKGELALIFTDDLDGISGFNSQSQKEKITP
jgi:hypothetical protein